MDRRLTRRQVEIMMLVARGLGNDEIAEVLRLSRRTVQTHLSEIYSRLGVNSRTGALWELGWIVVPN